jgi:iron complex outermembrane receptor protein
MRSFFLCVLLFCAGNIYSQNTIDLKFKVTNSSKILIQSAEIKLLNTELLPIKNSDGIILFKNLIKGNYTAEISALGYSTVVQKIEFNETKEVAIEVEYDYKKLSDVVISGSKRELDYYKNPGSISTFNNKQIKDSRIWEIADLSGLVPNMNLGQSGDNRNVSFIRGIGTTSYEQAVATYIDGVAQFGLDTYLPQLIDIERIEILRGPQGTLYGRNANAGLINIITKKPSNTTSFNADISVAGFGQKRLNGSLKFPLIKNKLFGSVSLLSDIKNGYYTNDFNKSNFDKQNQTGANAHLTYLINEKWSAQLDHKMYRAKNNGAFPLVGDITELFKNPFHLSQNQTAAMRDNTRNSSLVLKYKGEKVNLLVQHAIQQNYRYYENSIDGDFSSYDIVGVFNNYGKDFNRVNVFTQEIKFSSADHIESKLKWVLGSYIYSQNSPTKQATVFGKDAGFYGIPDQDFSIISNNLAKNKGVAVYGNGVLSLTKKISLTGGLRVDRENRKLTVSGAYEKQPNPVFITNPDTTGSISYAAISPKLGIQYNRTENSIYYITYNRGFRTGGLTSISSDPSQVPLVGYKPEYSNTFEAGIKGEELNKRIRFAVAAFYNVVTDIQVPTLILPDAITVTRNAGKMNSKGLEYELVAIPVNGLTLQYSGGITDSKFLTFKTGQNGNIVDLSGKKQIFTPASTNLFTAQFQHKLGGKGNSSLLIRGEYKIIGKQYFDISNTIEQKKYTLLNIKAGIQTSKLDLFVWIRNAGNTKFIDYAYDFGAAHLGNPKIIGTTLSVRL